ncbi:MAG: sodium/solute symporter [Ignavibacteriae bacterium]|nr:sodium/solute symporter [Ignavibacteriota bacterium]
MKEIKKINVLFILLFFYNVISIYGQNKSHYNVIWSELPQLPPSPNSVIQPGLAGSYIGIYNDILIVAGGANFPENPPWKGGKKIWHDDIYLLDLKNPVKWITSERLKLPFEAAYGVSIEDKNGLIIIGGSNSDSCYSKVFILKPDIRNKNIEIINLPSLPIPLAFMTGARNGNNIFIASGQEDMSNAISTKNFFMLDLSKKTDSSKFKWEKLQSWPGPSRILPVSSIQSNGSNECFYLFSGRSINPNNSSIMLNDSYRYNLISKTWKKLNDIRINDKPLNIMAGTGIESGANHILVFSGDNGEVFQKLENLTNQINSTQDINQKNEFSSEKLSLLNNHQGFSKDILAYHTITDTWIKAGEIKTDAPVTTRVVKNNNSFIIPSGEIKPGIRTPLVLKAEFEYKREFGLLNYMILSVYLSGLVFMGFYFSKREKTTNDFFKAGGRIPWWAAALSIFGTLLSAITFMAIPAKVYATNWSYFVLNASMLIVAPFIAHFILPFYRRLNLTTAYEFLEMRFNLIVRLLGSLVFILFQLGRIGIVLFLPSIALSLVSGINIYVCISVLGILSIFYTVLGGIEAVIWTDVIQVIVLIGGALISLVILIINGGIENFSKIAKLENKLMMFDFNFSLSHPTFWVILIGGIFINFINYGTDQTVIQRYLTTKDEKSASKSIWINAILPLFSTVLFFAIGTALYVFYKTHPGELNIAITNTDAIFPWYIITQLPAGISGILIAAVFSASMSSLDSSMNSVATAFTTDFYKRFKKNATDHQSLIIARIVTLVIGIFGTTFALLMVSWEIKSLWDQFNLIVGLFVGGLGGIFLLGMFTKKANGIGAIIGLVFSAILQYLLSNYTDLNLLLYAASGFCSAVIIGYLFSLIFPVKNNKAIKLD